MNTINLSDLSLSELIRIQQEIPNAIIKAKKNAKKNLRKKIEALVLESGFKLDELFSEKIIKKAKKDKKVKKIKVVKRKVAPKYRNPRDADQTWAGRGRRPKWVEQHLVEYGDLENVTIKNNII